MRTRIATIALAVGSMLCGSPRPASGQEHPKGHSAGEMNRPFRDPKLDVNKYVDRFESDTREIAAKRQEIIDAIGLRPGMAVADIGAGTGLFTFPFAEKVGPEGTVYAVDIAPAFLKHLREQAKKKDLERTVKPIQGTQDATNLPPDSIDVAFICATYHHFEHPEKVLASIHRALKPGGRLIIIDFDLRKDSPPFVREHARGPKEVYFQEIQAAGFAPIDTPNRPDLKDDFFAAFRRTALEAPSPKPAGQPGSPRPAGE